METVKNAVKKTVSKMESPDPIPPFGKLEKIQRCGDLNLTFTTKFNKIWEDKGSGAQKDASFWQPQAPENFHVLGQLCVPSYDDPNNENWALCVQVRKEKPSDPLPPFPLLMLPERFDSIWTRSYKIADEASCWRPVPPAGYIALGDVFCKGIDPPSVKAEDCPVWCVHESLVGPGVKGSEIWNNALAGMKTQISCCKVEAMQVNLPDNGDMYLAVNSFMGFSSVEEVTPHCLKLPAPHENYGDYPDPVLTGYHMPEPTIGDYIDRRVILPFTAVNDQRYPLKWIMENSPFYSIKRSRFYDLIEFGDNQQGNETVYMPYSVETGVSTSESQKFSIDTGVKVSYETGVAALGGSLSVELTVHLGFEEKKDTKIFSKYIQEGTFLVPAKRVAAMWSIATRFTVCDAKDDQISHSLEFGDSYKNFINTYYPVLGAETLPAGGFVQRKYRKS